jgi:hypothetical protein
MRTIGEGDNYTTMYYKFCEVIECPSKEAQDWLLTRLKHHRTNSYVMSEPRGDDVLVWAFNSAQQPMGLAELVAQFQLRFDIVTQWVCGVACVPKKNMKIPGNYDGGAIVVKRGEIVDIGAKAYALTLLRERRK